MFYTKTVHIVSQEEGYLDDNGIWIEGGGLSKTPFKADIQPYNSELAYREYGYEGDVDYKVYMPIVDGVQLGTKIEVRDKMYKVVSHIVWDDYMILIVGDRDE